MMKGSVQQGIWSTCVTFEKTTKNIVFSRNSKSLVLISQTQHTLGQTYKCAVEQNETISLLMNKITPKSRNMRLYMMFIK